MLSTVNQVSWNRQQLTEISDLKRKKASHFVKWMPWVAGVRTFMPIRSSWPENAEGCNHIPQRRSLWRVADLAASLVNRCTNQSSDGVGMLSTMAAVKVSPSIAASIAADSVKTLPDGPLREVLLPQLTLHLAMGKWLDGNRDETLELARESRRLAPGQELQRDLDNLIRRLDETELADKEILVAAGKVFPLLPAGTTLAAAGPNQPVELPPEPPVPERS